MTDDEYIAHPDFDPDGPEGRMCSNFSERVNAFEHNPTIENAAFLQIAIYEMKWEYDDSIEMEHDEFVENALKPIRKTFDEKLRKICQDVLDKRDYVNKEKVRNKKSTDETIRKLIGALPPESIEVKNAVQSKMKNDAKLKVTEAIIKVAKGKGLSYSKARDLYYLKP